MNCDSILKLLPLYYYGELTPEEEERVEEHAHACTACAGGLLQQRALAAALDRRQMVPAPMLLEDCRSDLMAAIQGGAPRVEPAAKGPWRLFLDALSSSFSRGSSNGMAPPLATSRSAGAHRHRILRRPPDLLHLRHPDPPPF